MKNKFQNSIFILFAFFLASTTISAQTGAPRSADSFFDVDIPSFFQSAMEVNKEYPTSRQIASLNPREVGQPLIDIFKQGRYLLDSVIRTNGRMSQQQANGFINELKGLEAQIARTQKPMTCHGACEHDFPGWGKGQGWKRFWCKMACIKINFPGGGGAQGQ